MHRIANDKVINQQVQRGWNICLYQKTLLLVEYRGSVSFQNLIVSFPISKQCIQQQETACMCVTEYCYLYLAFSRIDWVLNYIMREQWVDRVIFLYQHKVSMNECCRCESAADLVHFSSSAIKATVLQCSTLHPSVHNKKKKSWIKGSYRPPALGHLRLWESTAVSAPRPKHASYSCLAHACRTALSVYTQTAQAREYINHRLHSDLDNKFLFWLHILTYAKFRYMLYTQFSGGRVLDWSYESCNTIVFDWMLQVQIGFPLTPPPLPA